MNNAPRTYLELPASQSIDAATMALLNDRLRTISAALDAQKKTTVTTPGTGGGSGPSELVLSVPGTLSVHSSVAPLVLFGQDLQASSVIAVVKQAPVGADLKLRLLAGAAVVAGVTITAGMTKGTATGISGNIPANSLVVLDVLQVGTTFPGADLSVIAAF